jgi:hypothetical protein
MKIFKRYLPFIAGFAVALALGLLMVVAASGTVPTTVLNVIQPGIKASHLAMDRYPKTGFSYENGSDKIYLYLGNHILTQYDAFTAFFETASDTWASDQTYVWEDTDGELNKVIGVGNLRDTYSNTITGAATAGGRYVIYAWRGV